MYGNPYDVTRTCTMHTWRLHGAAPFWVVKQGAGSAGLAPAAGRWNYTACALHVSLNLKAMFGLQDFGSLRRLLGFSVLEMLHMRTHTPKPPLDHGTRAFGKIMGINQRESQCAWGCVYIRCADRHIGVLCSTAFFLFIIFILGSGPGNRSRIA